MKLYAVLPAKFFMIYSNRLIRKWISRKKRIRKYSPWIPIKKYNL